VDGSDFDASVALQAPRAEVPPSQSMVFSIQPCQAGSLIGMGNLI
jgi:hypothetical protein